jgi:phosphoribosylaminoimidazole (AIR) synthetase
VNARLTYKDAGVDIDKKESVLERAKGAIRKSFTPGCWATSASSVACSTGQGRHG